MFAPQPLRDEYKQHLFYNVLVKRTRLRTRNGETREWSLVAKRDIQAGLFLGFYTGSFVNLAPDSESLYAAEMGRRQPAILPFLDEEHISPQERDKHPFASANESSPGEHSNMRMAIQDFSNREVDRVDSIDNNGMVHFYRGLACFACADIHAGEQLTWHYGNTYQPNRVLKDYVVGFPCKLDWESSIKDDSRSVLDTIRLVPSSCVYPIYNRKIKSVRFRQKRPVQVDSDGEAAIDSSSGSGHEQSYKPRPSSRSRLDAQVLTLGDRQLLHSEGGIPIAGHNKLVELEGELVSASNPIGRKDFYKRHTQTRKRK